MELHGLVKVSPFAWIVLACIFLIVLCTVGKVFGRQEGPWQWKHCLSLWQRHNRTRPWVLKNKCSNFSFAIAPPGQYLQKDNFMEWLWIRGQQTGCPCPNPFIAKLLTLTSRVTLKFYQLLPTLRLSSAVKSFGNYYKLSTDRTAFTSCRKL